MIDESYFGVPKDVCGKVWKEVTRFVRESKGKVFSLKDLYSDDRFNQFNLKEEEKINLIWESIKNYESVGVVDRSGHDFYSNG